MSLDEVIVKMYRMGSCTCLHQPRVWLLGSVHRQKIRLQFGANSTTSSPSAAVHA
jgi:hypothetical protein